MALGCIGVSFCESGKRAGELVTIPGGPCRCPRRRPVLLELPQCGCRSRGLGKRELTSGYLKLEVSTMWLRTRTVKVMIWSPRQQERVFRFPGETKIAYRAVSRYHAQCEILMIRKDGT